MNSRNIQPQSPRSATATSSRPAGASKTVLIDHYIHRIATYQSAVLGSFYDARTECVLDKLLSSKTPRVKASSRKPVDCILMKGDSFDSENLFHKIGIYEESWLNSILNIAPAEGMAPLINYSFSKNGNTRFLYYYYSSEEQSISHEINKVRMYIPKDMPEISATHVISAIKLGIQAFIVLELSSNDETNIDCLLEKIREELISNKFEVSRNEKPLLDRITVTKVFSNIPDLNKISNLADICQKITVMKPHIYSHRPLEYNLRTIKWFYSSYPNEKAKYIPLKQESIKIIKQYLLSLSSKINELKTSLDPEVKQALEEHLNRQYHAFLQQITDIDVNKIYSIEIERIRDLVIRIRNGTIRQELITEMLINTSEQSLQNSIDFIVEHLRVLREKGQLINNFEQQNIKYVNMQQFSIQQNADLNTTFQKLCGKGKSKLILCSTDDLRDRSLPTWNERYRKWMKEHETNSSLSLVYADFSYTSFRLTEVKVLLIKSPDDIEEQSQPSSLPHSSTLEPVESPNKQFQNIKEPFSPSTLSDLSNIGRIFLPERQTINADEQPKPPKSPTLSISDIPLVVNEPNKDNKELFNSSISSKRSNVKKNSLRTEQRANVEDPTKISKSSSLPISKPPSRNNKQFTNTETLDNSLESAKASTTERITLLKEQIDHTEDQHNILKPPIMPTPQITPRTEKGSTNIGKPLSDQTSLKSSTAKRISPSQEQPYCPDEHVNLSESPPISAPESTRPTKEQTEDTVEQIELSNRPTSSTPETAESSNKESQSTKEPFSLSRSPNLSNIERTFPREQQSLNTDGQPKPPKSPAPSTSNLSLALNQPNKDKEESANSSISSKRSDVENTSSQTQQLDCTEASTNPSRPSTPSTSRIRRRSRKDEKQLNSIGSSNSSATESTALSNEQTNNGEEQYNILEPSTMSSPQVTPRTKKQPTNIEKPLSDQTSSKSPPILSSETAQQTEKQSKDTEEQSNQLKSLEPLSTEYTVSPNHIERQSEAPSSQILSTPEVTARQRQGSNSSHLSTVNYINILLLGESGVGKSTFINALVNYHAFETLEQARSDQPLVVMPVSFLMTVGDNFEEKIIRFGGVDSNEDHEHPGQSVTQHCKSYVFQIGTQTKLRIIDTPGMGDTRGLAQDDLNMQHILSFINNLSHLNAVCILLKPNESKLTVVLRSYFNRLLNFLGENARNNIVFCFTNTRATFFAPGNTGPLLKEMLRNLPIKDIPFQKANTFCFDSESFRYLVALQNEIKFDDYQKEEYKRSWITSVDESSRLLQYICGELKSYPQIEWQSIEHAQFKITQIIRPILETTRNILRNIILLKEKSSRPLIKLLPIVLSEPSAVCYKCQRTPKRFSDFWILPDDLHTFSDKCKDCDCSRKRHIDVDYKLEYELTQYEGAQSFNKMKTDFDQLKMAILEFGQFYAYVIDTLKQNDPIFSTLKRMIVEENEICSEQGSTCLNSNLHEILIRLKEEYNQRRTISISIHLPVDLSSIYERIKSISQIDEIKEQIHIIKQAQKKFLKQHEKQVL